MKEVDFTPDETGDSPLDVVEQVLEEEGIKYEREDKDELVCNFTGRLCEYYLAWSWLEEVGSIHLACSFDIVVPAPRLAEFRKLLCQINQEVWIGHFDIHTNSRSVLFRAPLVLGDHNPTAGQCLILLHTALQTCEKYFQCFQFAIWGGVTAEKAMQHLLIHETKGEA